MQMTDFRPAIRWLRPFLFAVLLVVGVVGAIQLASSARWPERHVRRRWRETS
jgi:hypothetical protein